MAVTDVSPGGIPEKGVTYSKITSDGSFADTQAIPNDTYFYDLSDDLPYYKTSTGALIGVYSSNWKKPNVFQATNKSNLSLDFALCGIQFLTEQDKSIVFSAPSPTPHNGGRIALRIKDDGTARSISWDNVFRGIYADLPSKTIPGETTYLEFIYNELEGKYDLISPSRDTVQRFISKTTTQTYSSASSVNEVLMNKPLVANTLHTNGDWIEVTIVGVTDNNSNTKNLYLTFNGETLAGNTTTPAPNGLDFVIKTNCIRISNSNIKCSTTIEFDGIPAQSSYKSITGLDLLANDYDLDFIVSAQSSGDVLMYFANGTKTNY